MSRKLSFQLIGAVIVACYAVPYLLLGRAESWAGSFLFWCIAGVVIIFLNIAATANFDRDSK